MKHLSQQTRPRSLSFKVQQRGFALISTISIMVLLVLIVIGMLALSTTETKKAKQSEHQLIAQANARMALMIALSEAQEALGPDRRISAYATILDTNAESDDIDGVNNPRLLGVWDSWGAWLNADYTKDDGTKLNITDTYDKGRSSMFRRWLVSGSESDNESFDFAKSGDLTTDSVTLVGQNSVTETEDQVRARLFEINDTGRGAWWVGGRNQAADVLAYGEKANDTAEEAELKSGDNAVIAVDKVEGFENIPPQEEELNKIINHRQLELAQIDKEDVRDSFFDVTTGSASVLSDVRWGGLKKDLNLLFEQNTLPADYRRDSSRAPSPRPLSSDLLALSPALPQRGFSSFEQMHQFYRAYKNGGSPTPLKWNGKAPATEHHLGHSSNYGHAEQVGYHRMPVVAKYYSVYSTLTSSQPRSNAQGRYDLDVVFSTVMVLWNPYNVPLEVPDNHLFTYTLPYKILPSEYIGYRNDTPLNANWIPLRQGSAYNEMGRDFSVPIRSEASGQPIRFAPGQFRIFSKKGVDLGGTGGGAADSELTPGYDPAGIFGQRMGVYTNKPQNDPTKWGVAVRLTPLWNFDGTAQYWGGNPGALGNLIRFGGANAPVSAMGTMFDWTAADYDRANISGTGSGNGGVVANGVEAASWDMSVVDEPTPFAVVGLTLKSAALLDYGAINPNMPDYRSKSWVQGLNSIAQQKMHINYNDPQTREFQRLDNGYQLHFTEVTSINDVSRLFNIDGNTQSLASLSSDEIVYSVPTLEIPTVPVTSVAGFAGMRLTPGWFDFDPSAGSSSNQIVKSPNSRFLDNTYAYSSGVPGIGVGNSFAQPSISGDKIYQRHDISKNNPGSNSGGPGGAVVDSLVLSDFWDHALLVNDGLWDSWFTSGMVDATRNSATSAVNLNTRVNNFFTSDESLPYQGYTPWEVGANSAQKVSETLADDGFLKVAALIKNNSTFNVNSTSVEAWFALFAGLKHHDTVYRDASGTLNKISTSGDDIVLSRFITAPSDLEVIDVRQGADVPAIGKSWTGVRVLTDDHMRKLAEECVKQVKTRGPFLNMSDFINRRLATGATGLSGMLQAAIDYDDQSPDSSSINFEYKQGGDMITSANSAYPFPQAANGSRFTGAPGYVVQSDLLRPLGNALTVRDDSFVIRAYGESRDESGKVMSKAWCEAVVQRTPDYVDATNQPHESAIKIDNNGNASQNTNLSDTNHRLGRRLKIVSFRWLSPQEI